MPEGAGWQATFAGRDAHGFGPVVAERALGQVGLGNRCEAGLPAIGESADAAMPLDRAAEAVLIGGDAFEPIGRDEAQARPSRRCTEYAPETG